MMDLSSLPSICAEQHTACGCLLPLSALQVTFSFSGKQHVVLAFSRPEADLVARVLAGKCGHKALHLPPVQLNCAHRRFFS